MQYRTLGNSNIRVSALSLGSWMTYEFMEEQDALAVIRAAIDAGINFLDDARYNDRTGHAPMKTGYSEVLFGRLLREGRLEARRPHHRQQTLARILSEPKSERGIVTLPRTAPTGLSRSRLLRRPAPLDAPAGIDGTGQ